MDHRKAWELPDEPPDPEETLKEFEEIDRVEAQLYQMYAAGKEAPGECCNCKNKLDWNDVFSDMYCMGCSHMMCVKCAEREMDRNLAATGDVEPTLCDACKGEGVDLVHPPSIDA
jgi:hypothetical protein